MLPYFEKDNLPDLGMTNSENGTKTPMCMTSQSVKPSDFPHLILCQLVKWLSLAIENSPLGHRVIDVLAFSSEKQMIWINAPRNVTTMKDKHAIRNLRSEHLPRNPVGQFHFSAHPDFTVPISKFWANPIPAALSLVYIVKEASERIVPAFKTDWSYAVYDSGREAVDFTAAPSTLCLHLKTFLLGVSEAIGSSRWLFHFATIHPEFNI